MNKRVLLIVGTIILAIGGGLVYLLSTDQDDKAMQAATQTDETSDAVSITPATGQSVPGTYVDYSSSVIADTDGTKLLFFHAPWCPQCRDLDADIKKQGVPDNVTIIKVDYDSNQTLRKTYGVTIQTTVVRVDDNGDIVEKFVAYDEPTLAAVTQRLL